MARGYDEDDDSPFDRDGVLRDGRTARISMQMRDAAMTRDAVARLGFDDRQCRHQPGPAIVADRSAARDAYLRAAAEAEDAWRTPSEAADQRHRRKVTMRDPQGRETGTWEEEREDAAIGVSPPRGQRPGDVCSINGARQDARPVHDAAEGRRIKDAAYAEMVRDLENAWRT